MNRDYIDGKADDVVFFTGIEIEKTLAYGKRTLFVVGMQSMSTIAEICENKDIEHIYLGANHSFNPTLGDVDAWNEWTTFIRMVINTGLLVTIDHDIKYSAWFLESCWAENINVIPMVSIKLPYIDQYGYNASFKIDDKDFNSTNAGVWVHSLQVMMNPDVYTHWSEYKKDLPI